MFYVVFYSLMNLQKTNSDDETNQGKTVTIRYGI